MFGIRKLHVFSALVLVLCILLAIRMGSTASKLEAAKASNLKATLAGKQALIFGGTSGIGRGIAERLAAGGASVTIVGRNEEAAAEIVKNMKDRAPAGNDAQQLDFVRGDVMRIKGCDEAVAEFSKKAARLDYIVFCQTKATTQGLTKTEPDGIDEKLALNYYSRVYLAEQLQAMLNATADLDGADVRVLSVLSAGVHGVYKQYAEDPYLESNYGMKTAADAAGLYNDMWVDHASKTNPKVTFLHAAPGFVSTNWGTDMAAPLRGAIRCMQAVGGRSIADCAEFMMLGLLDAEYRGGPRYIGEFGQAVDRTPVHSDAVVATVMANTKKHLDDAVARNAKGQ